MITPSEVDLLTITIVYDNNPYDPRLRTAWGFSALVEYKGGVVLFDTGGDAPTLLDNMRLLEIDPAQIKIVAISHAHGDHTGGLEGLLMQEIFPTVYLLPSFSSAYKQRVSQMTAVVEVTPGQSLAEGVFTTGEMDGSIPEQALVVKTGKGLVVITGCAHPGIVQVIEEAKALYHENVHLVLGGFHLRDKSNAELEAIVAAFRRLGVEKAAPCHCTGDQAIKMFKDEYGAHFIEAGVGRVIVVEP